MIACCLKPRAWDQRTCSLTSEWRIKGEPVGSSLPLGTLRQHKQHRTKTAIGQQALPKARPKQKNIGHTKANKLELEKTNFMEKMQLALLESKRQGSEHCQRHQLEDLSDLELDEKVAAENN